MGAADPVKEASTSSRGDVAAGGLVAGLAAILLPAASMAALLLWPRAAPPVELPSLALPRAEVAAALAAEDALAARAPSGEIEDGRRALYREHGLAEIRGADEPRHAADRRARIEQAIALLREEGGDEAIASARAADVIRAERALEGEGSDADRAGEIGRFADVLARWNAVEGGARIAPRIVVRALAAARWNGIHGLPLTLGLEGAHLRAYHGWLALHGAIGLSDLRARALADYAAAGGSYAHEALGTLLYLEGELDAARVELEASHAATGNVRVRNHALAALAASAGE